MILQVTVVQIVKMKMIGLCFVGCCQSFFENHVFVARTKLLNWWKNWLVLNKNVNWNNKNEYIFCLLVACTCCELFFFCVFQEQEKLERDAREDSDAVLNSNPLMPGELASDSTIKRKWYDETIFKNQARDEPKKAAKRFVNDTIRSNFHRQFMDKYIK